MKSEFLIVTNGFKGTWSAIEYGAALAQAMQMKTTLLGVTEELNPAAIDDHHPLEDIFAQAVELFQKLGVEYALDIRNGIAEKIVPEIANRGDLITVVSPLGRPQFKRWLTGRSIRSLLEAIRNPILYVPESRLPLKHVLITIGGLGYEDAAEILRFRSRARARQRSPFCMLFRPPIWIIPARAACRRTSTILQRRIPCPGAVCERRWRSPNKLV